MKTRRWLITVGACLLVFAALAAYKVNQIRSAIAIAESFPEPSETVEAVVTKSKLVRPSVSTLGEVIAPQMVTLRNEIEGRVTEVNFESGAIVKQGQILLQLDVSEERARLQSAQASAELARLDLQRIQKLSLSQIVSQERLDQSQAQYDIAEANIKALQAIIDKKTLRAPFDAYTGLHSFEPGEFLQSNTLITTLVGISNYVWIDFNLPHQETGLDIGTNVEVSLVDPRSRQAENKMTAVVIARDSILSAASRNLRLRARLDPDSPIPPNTVVNVTIPSGLEVSQTTVPATSIVRDGLGSYVYILQEDKANNGYRALRRKVTLGERTDNGSLHTVSLTSGLEEGELVATNGAFKLREGLLVFIKDRKPLANLDKE